MEEIFLINANPSDYDSSPYAVGFVENEEKAKALVQKMSLEYKFAEEYSDILYTARKKLDQELPQPIFENRIEIPRWPAGLGAHEITPDMKSERESLVKLRYEIDMRNSDKIGERNKVILENTRHIFDSIPDSIKHYFDKEKFFLKCRLDVNPYTYEKVSKI